jgi:CRP-like cAMP-binding protein
MQALRDAEAGATLAHQVIQAHGLRIVIEDQRRAELGVLVFAAAQDAAVLDAFEHRELSLRLAHAGLAVFGHSLVVQRAPPKQEIARMIGASREMVSRVIKDLQEKNLIRTDKRKIIVLDRQSMGRRGSA